MALVGDRDAGKSRCPEYWSFTPRKKPQEKYEHFRDPRGDFMRSRYHSTSAAVNHEGAHVFQVAGIPCQNIMTTHFTTRIPGMARGGGSWASTN
jgi:hypothetical protein